MMGIVVPETCWAYKKYDKIISDILLVFILQLRQSVVLMTTLSFCCCYTVRVEGHTFVVQDKQVPFLVALRKESARSLCIQSNRTTPSSHTSYRVNALFEDNRVHADRRTASCTHLTWQGQYTLCIKSHDLVSLSANGSTSADKGMCCDVSRKLGSCSSLGLVYLLCFL